MSNKYENIAFTILGAAVTITAICTDAGIGIIGLGVLITAAGIYCLISNNK